MQRRLVAQPKKEIPLLETDLTDKIIGAAIEVHRALGPGLLESAYQLCTAQESRLEKLPCTEQIQLKLKYKGIELDGGYRIDFIFDNRVVVEIKAVEQVLPEHEAQLLTYLKLTGTHVGLLINFNLPVLKNGIYRRVL